MSGARGATMAVRVEVNVQLPAIQSGYTRSPAAVARAGGRCQSGESRQPIRQLPGPGLPTAKQPDGQQQGKPEQAATQQQQELAHHRFLSIKNSLGNSFIPSPARKR